MPKSSLSKAIFLVIATLALLVIFVFFVLPLNNLILTIMSVILIVTMIVATQLFHSYTLFKRDKDDQAVHMRPCPHCAIPIYKTDKACPYCKKTFDDEKKP